MKTIIVFAAIFLMGTLAYWGVSNFEIRTKSAILSTPPASSPTPTPSPSSTPTPTTQRIDNTQLRKNCVDNLERERVNIAKQYIESYQTDENLKQYDFKSGIDSLENLYKEKKEECYKIYK